MTTFAEYLVITITLALIGGISVYIGMIIRELFYCFQDINKK